MSQSRTLYIGMDGHKASIAIAYVAQAQGAAVVSCGTLGTRQGDIDKLIRQCQSKSKQLVFVYEAGPCSYWLYRYLTKGCDRATPNTLRCLLLASRALHHSHLGYGHGFRSQVPLMDVLPDTT